MEKSKNEYIYVVSYKHGNSDWIIFPEGVFVSEEGAKRAADHIYQDFRGGSITKIEKFRILD